MLVMLLFTGCNKENDISLATMNKTENSSSTNNNGGGNNPGYDYFMSFDGIAFPILTTSFDPWYGIDETDGEFKMLF